MLENSNPITAKQQRDTLLEAWTCMVNCISHDLTAPLALIGLENNTLEETLPILLAGYRLAVQHKLIEPLISEEYLQSLTNTSTAIEKSLHAIYDFLNLLNPYNKRLYSDTDPPLQLGACLQEILKNYPFNDEQRSKVYLDCTYDFQFRGDIFFVECLMFDLLEKALYRIKRKGTGEIHIWAAEEDNYFTLHFKETTGELDNRTLAAIFKNFFIKRDTKIVPALGFCRLKWLYMGGNIICNTEKEQYTDYIIKFPKIGLEVI